MNDQNITPEMENLKAKLHKIWSAGDFSKLAELYKNDAEDFIERLNLRSGMKVLDVACGSGNLALPAARVGADVTGVDIAEYLIEKARENAEAENLKIRFDVGDAEDLPYEDAEFDAVVTMFGAMFAPRPEIVASELKRVCRAGGKMAMANWTPNGFIGQMFKINGKYVPPPDMPSPILWGDETTVRERLKDGIAEVKTTPRMITFSYPFSPAETVEFFRTFYGPTQMAFNALNEEKQAALRRELEEHWTNNNLAEDGTTRVESEYLEVIAERG